jgi:hypothetical protein
MNSRGKKGHDQMSEKPLGLIRARVTLAILTMAITTNTTIIIDS